MKRTKAVRDCLNYILDSERDDFIDNCIVGESEPLSHIYSSAYIAMHGQSQFETMVHDLKTDADQNGTF